MAFMGPRRLKELTLTPGLVPTEAPVEGGEPTVVTVVLLPRLGVRVLGVVGIGDPFRLIL